VVTCEQPQARTELGVLFCDDSLGISIQILLRTSMSQRRFPPPWSVEQQPACFVVRDHNGQQLALIVALGVLRSRGLP
jgi:hypothetical protein